MKIIQHGSIAVFKCGKCGCEFSEVAKECYSSTGGDGIHCCLNCPDCNNTCWCVVDGLSLEE